MKQSYILVLLAVAVPTVRLWSDDAHRVIAVISARFLTFKGRHFIAEHLGGHADVKAVGKTMMSASIFADTVEWSKSLHFSHTPYRDCAEFKMERDCHGGRCIVTGLGNYTSRATRLDLSKEDRAEAVKFLIHLVADIHHPLHVGFEEDAGGNDIKLSSPSRDDGQDQNLHHVWDYELVKRKQVEYGVFTQAGGDNSAEPWKLSEASLQQIPNTRALRAHLMLDVDSEDLKSERAAVAVASRMASETSTRFTCKFAYQRGGNSWIKNGESLDEQYLNTRSDIAIELLQKAAVRLSEILNSLAFLYFKRKQKDLSSSTIRQGTTTSSSSLQSRIFFDFDFDPEELIEDSDMVDDKVFTQCTKERLPDIVRDFKERRKKKSSRVTIKTKREKTGTDTEEDVFEGVDLKRATLVERQGDYLITDKKFKGRKGFAPQFVKFSVRFDGNPRSDPVILFLDTELVNYQMPSDALVSRIIAKIRKIDSYQFRTDEGALQERLDPLIAPVVMAEGLTPLKYYSPFLHAHGSPSAEGVCLYIAHRVELFILKETLMGGEAVMKTNMYRFEDRRADPPVLWNMLIDEKLYSGSMTSTVFRKFFLAPTAKIRRNRGLSATMLRARPTLLYELSDISSLMFGTDPNRSLNFKQIKWFIEMKSESFDFSRFHWSLLPLQEENALHRDKLVSSSMHVVAKSRSDRANVRRLPSPWWLALAFSLLAISLCVALHYL